MTMMDSFKDGLTGTWVWHPPTDLMFWSRTMFCILGLESRKATPSLEKLLGAIHRSERPLVELAFRNAASEGRDFEQQCAIIRPGSRMRHVHLAGCPVLTSTSARKYVGLISDITARCAAEETVRHTQAELARASRVLAMDALTTSIAHDINQPLAAVITNSNA